jgi:N-acetylmuramoyl-L-alanine amidase
VPIKVKNIKFLLLLIPSVIAFFSFKTGSNKGRVGGIKTIVIDAGHGGKDPGCNGNFAKEKDVSLSVALKLGKLIESQFKDIKVIYTRTTDVFVDLEDRAMIANKAKADLFISIHCNASGKFVKYRDPQTNKMKVKMRKNKKGKYVPVETTNPIPFGSETYVMGLKNEEGKMRVATRENSVIFLEDDYEKKYEGFDPDSEESYIIMSNYTSAYVIQSANLALKIQDEYSKKAGRIDKGVHRQSIWVLWRTAMPSILTEIGYLTNPLEEQFLASEKGQDYISKAIFRGLRRYKDEIEGNKKEYSDEIENQDPLENENIKAGNLPGQKAKDDDGDIADSDTKKDSVELITKDANRDIFKEERKAEIEKQKKDSLEQTKRETEAKVRALAVTRYKYKLDSIAAAKTVTEKNNNTVKIKSGIIFKVQFASSDVELDLKDPKYTQIKNGSYYKVNTLLKYTSGNFTDMNEASSHQLILKQNGFKDCFVVAFKNGDRIDINKAKEELEQK